MRLFIKLHLAHGAKILILLNYFFMFIFRFTFLYEICRKNLRKKLSNDSDDSLCNVHFISLKIEFVDLSQQIYHADAVFAVLVDKSPFNVNPLTYLFLSTFQAYKTPGSISGRGQNIYNCDYGQDPPRGQVCDVDIKSWAPCVQENYYSYHKSSPCIFLKLNKIFGWVPHFYNDSGNLPGNMPQDLQSFISETAAKEPLAVSE